MERCGLGMQLGSHIRTFGSVGKCEGMNPQIPKGIPILRVGIPMDFRIFKKPFEGSKLIKLIFFYSIEKLLTLRCLKWGRIIHLSTYNTSHVRKKG